MIAKKNKKADLERKRFAFLQIGLLVSGSLCLAAFEYSEAIPAEKQMVYEDTGENLIGDIQIDFVEEMQQQQKQQAVVNLDELEDIEVVEDITETGDVVTTTGNETISIDGDIGEGLLSDKDLTIKDPTDEILPISEVDPEFPGGKEAMFEYIRTHVKYPQLCRELGIGGIVYVQFVVNKDGSITQVNAKQAPHEELAKESEQVVSSMPKWKPGEQAGKKVRVRYTLPIHFTSN